MYIQETAEAVAINALYHVYNSLAKLIKESTDLGNLALTTKTEKEVGAKYTQHCKEAALFESLNRGSKQLNPDTRLPKLLHAVLR